jgi:hypothetical protein
MYDPIDTTTVGPFTVEVHQDPDPTSPREWDNVGRFGGLSDWTFNDDNTTGPADAYQAARAGREPILMLPVYVLDGPYPIIRETDWEGAEGIYWAAVAEVDAIGDHGYRTIADLKAALRAELAAMNQYLEGDVYGYVVKAPDGGTLESCWGFMDDRDGVAYAMSEGQDMARYLLRATPRWVLDTMEAHTDA